jgi:Cu(I)/Ag(I) efflux system membrane fusion protein
MDLIAVQQGGPAGAGADRVTLSERAKALMKLQTSVVVRERRHAGEVRLLGLVEPNESTLKTITVWTGGRIDRLHVNTTGQHVAVGQVIATLYSPEVLAAHQDLIVAKRQVERLAGGHESARAAAGQALDAARSRLRLLGLPEDELRDMERHERPTTAVRVRSPFAGTVLERIATEGVYVATGAPLFRVANLSSLWLQLDAYEADLPNLKLNQAVSVNVRGLDERFEGEVTFIEPTLDPTKRTAKVRVVVDSKKGKLRPGMFAEAVVQGTAPASEPPLVVPASAPLFTGQRALVYVELPNMPAPTYEPRVVRLGPRLGEVYPVVAGLEEGERIVTRGAFALDADLQIRGGASMMSHDGAVQSAAGTALALSAPQRSKLAPVVQAYLVVQRALAADDLAQAKRGAAKLEEAAKAVRFTSPAEVVPVWRELSARLVADASRLAAAPSIEASRSAFEALSAGTVQLLAQLGNPLEQSLSVAFCSMAFGSRGASWVQAGTNIDNAYFGASMRSCGEVEQKVAPGSLLTAQPRGVTASPQPPSHDHGAP